MAMTTPDLHERMAAMRALRVPGKPQSAKGLWRRRKARYELLRAMGDSHHMDFCLRCFHSSDDGRPVIRRDPKIYGPHDCALAESQDCARRERERAKRARLRLARARA